MQNSKETPKFNRRIWKCDCGNEDQEKIVIAEDGEVVCKKCGTVLGQVMKKVEKQLDQFDTWDPEGDLRRKLLEERVSKKGWEF